LSFRRHEVPGRHLHPPETLHALGPALSEEAVIPIDSTRCALAGDRGVLHPEPTRSATEEHVEDQKGRRFDRYVSSNRTCQIGMNLATGQHDRSAVLLLGGADPHRGMSGKYRWVLSNRNAHPLRLAV
jgi:hypothetical protein